MSSSSPAPQPPTAAGAAPAARLLVWVGNNDYAEALVRDAHRWASAAQMPWTVVSVETPTTSLNASSQRSLAAQALLLAERLGARTDNLVAQTALGAVVERVRAEHATVVMLGGHPPDGWLDEGLRLWLGALADALSARLPDVTVQLLQYPPRAPAAARDRRDAASTSTSTPLSWPAALLAMAVVALCTAIAAVLEPYLSLATIDIVFLSGIVYVALYLGQPAAMLSVFASIFVFDLIFVPPRWSLKPTDPQYYFNFVVMLVIGVLVSRLVVSARLQARLAAARAGRAQALNDLARLLVAARSDVEIRDGLTTALRATFGVEAVLWLPDEQGRLLAAAPAGTWRLDIAQALFDGAAAGEGAPDEPATPAIHKLLRGATGSLGVLAVVPAEGRLATPEERQLLDAFANQAALALERLRFERRGAAAALAAEAERLRSTLLSGISHDFRTPLTTIIGSASTLLEQDAALDPARRTHLLRGVIDEAQRIHSAMSDLLDLTRMEEGAVQPNCEWCPADDLIAEALSSLAPRLGSRVVKVHVPADAVVWCDARLLEQLVINLIDNALRHTPAGCVIDVGVEVGATQWSLFVKDDGPGLPPGQERAVFHKFARARSEPTGSGTGLGLAICAAVARLHHGSIEAGNDGGARFTLTLPQPASPVWTEAV